jgi:hypothetical protein
MSQAFGFPAFPVDTHIHRLMKQWKLTEGKNVVQTENDAKKLFPKETGTNFTSKLFSTEENILPLVEIRSEIILRRCFLRDNVVRILFCHHHCFFAQSSIFLSRTDNGRQP